jgi:hypothetical protein
MSSVNVSKVSFHPKWYIQHNYRDHSKDIPLNDEDFEIMRYFAAAGNQKTLRVVRFPLLLHMLLLFTESEGYSHIISWQVHDRAFKIHKDKEFSEKVLPIHFSHNNIQSFYRQLNLYGFKKITQGPDKGAYYHELFLRGMYFLARRIFRKKVKGTFVKGTANPSGEPNFYNMLPIDTTSNCFRLSAAQKDQSYGNDEANFLHHSKNDILLGVTDLDDLSADGCPTDTSISVASFFQSDEEPCSSRQEPKIYAGTDDKKRKAIYNTEDIYIDISLEDDLLYPNQHYTFKEYMDMRIMLQMVINLL